MAITDPGTELEKLAQREGFRKVFHGVPSVGGRFSALSHFGMVPAAAMGVSVPRLLDRALVMADACARRPPGEQTTRASSWGSCWGARPATGVDKLTLVGLAGHRRRWATGWSSSWPSRWESTGRGSCRWSGEPPGTRARHGEDRLHVYVRLASAPSEEQDRAVAALERAGAPVVRIDVSDPADLGQEFFRWEIATAVAGSILGVNPFDQPDVEAAKVAARKVTAAVRGDGVAPSRGRRAAGRRAPALRRPGERPAPRRRGARADAGRLDPGPPRAARQGGLPRHERLPGAEPADDRGAPGDPRVGPASARVATTLGFGPRFLHSTGQLHKGGPNSGVFLVITADDAEPLPIPGRRFGFGVLARAQARGDHDVLAERGRRVLRVHLGADVKAGLAALRRAMPR